MLVWLVLQITVLGVLGSVKLDRLVMTSTRLQPAKWTVVFWNIEVIDCICIYGKKRFKIREFTTELVM